MGGDYFVVLEYFDVCKLWCLMVVVMMLVDDGCFIVVLIFMLCLFFVVIVDNVLMFGKVCVVSLLGGVCVVVFVFVLLLVVIVWCGFVVGVGVWSVWLCGCWCGGLLLGVGWVVLYGYVGLVL